MPGELFLCSVDAVDITSPFPAVWVSSVDVTNEAAGIHCGPLNPLFNRPAFSLGRKLSKWLGIPP